MNIKNFYYLYFIVAVLISVALFPDGFVAVVASAAIGIPVIVILRQGGDKVDDLLKIFLVALIVRTAVSATIHFMGLTEFFATDWILYEQTGSDLADYWWGDAPPTELAQARALNFNGTAWGISLFVGAIYAAVGRNLLAAQLVIAAIGAAMAPLAYLCAYQIYSNRRVAVLSGYIVALMPSLVLWSSLVLKDSIIIFFLLLTHYAALKLQEKLSYRYVAVLLFALSGVMTMRYYIFYIAAVAVVGSFVIGQKNTMRSIVGRSVAIVVIGVSLGYLGILRNSQFEISEMTSLERIQLSRKDLMQSAASGYGEDLDVSTTEGAITALPVGFAYLMLSPLPWQFTSTLAMTTLPEMILWWSMLPFLVIGLVYSFKNRLRKCIAVMTFSLMLTLGYSILQGNVGTAYRQRAQIQVFLLMFVAVGWTIMRERRENRNLLQQASRNQTIERLRAGN